MLRQEADAFRQQAAGLHEPPLSAYAETRSFTERRTGDDLEELARIFRTMRQVVEEHVRTIHVQHDELLRRERLTSVDQSLAGLVHDLRSPLSVIRSAAQLIVESSQPELVRQEVSRYIIDELDRLAHRISDFLRYARHKPPDCMPCSAEALAVVALRQRKAQGQHVSIDVVTELEPALQPVLVDPDQLKDILVNLLMNVGDAMPEGGQLIIRTKRGTSGGVEVEVCDTGCRIQAEEISRVVEPFYTTKEHGTDLGLTNAKQLVEDNGGAIEVWS